MAPLAKSAALDFDSALESLLGAPSAFVDALNPIQIRNAIDAFSGVLEPPDVRDVAAESFASDAGMVTSAHLADALAGDLADADLDVGMAMPSVLSMPDVVRGERFDLFERASGNSTRTGSEL